ncbi:MAG TPA: hypothetical protein VHL58_04150 [Thermoanaerobaculia bacterium]|nr:hypothetical protein [Thermoanaerobaculia bacterium]
MSSQPPSGATLSILASGTAQASQFAALLPLFRSVEQITVEGHGLLTLHGSRLNHYVDGAAADWILLLEERETVSPELARNIGTAVTPSPMAWGYRIRKVITYEGRPLNVAPADVGDVRLFHRRHARFDVRSSSASLKMQGTVIRLAGNLIQPTFESRSAHEDFLRSHGKARLVPARVGVFLLQLLKTGALWKGSASRRYLWVESGWETTS